MIGYQILQVIYQANPYSETQFRKVVMQILLAYEETVKIKLVSDTEEKQMLGFRTFN